MTKLISVKGYPGLARDPVSGAIVNINRNEIDKAKKNKRNSLVQTQRIDKLEQDIGEIKGLLLRMLEEKDGNNN